MKSATEHRQSQPLCLPLQPLTPPLSMRLWEYPQVPPERINIPFQNTGPNTLHAVRPGKTLQPIADPIPMHLLRGYRGE